MSIRIMILMFLTWLPSLAIAETETQPQDGWLLLALAIIVGGAGLSWIVRKLNLPTVLGELGLGMLLAVLAHFHLGFWDQVMANPTLTLLAELGSILLLFEIGLESSFGDLLSVGKHGLITALVGVIAPFLIGFFLIGMVVFASSSIQLNLFLGATLAATSTGISVRVFKDLGILRNPACQVVLTASIIDDILGLIILAFVSGLVVAGTLNLVTIGHILISVIIFFVLALLVARKLTPKLIKWVLKISHEESMVVVTLISICLFWAWFAHAIGLASIIGAFVAGLIMDEVVFRDVGQPKWYRTLVNISNNHTNQEAQQMIQDEIIVCHHHERLVDLIKPLNHVLVPIFFVYAGMQVDLIAVANWSTLFYGLCLSVAAIAGKLISGIFLPKAINRWIVGFGMVPRGEIGLIFALTGRQLGVFSSEIFAVVLLMVVVTSLITPLALQFIVKRGLR